MPLEDTSLGWFGDIVAQHLYVNDVPQPQRRRWSLDGDNWDVTDDPDAEVLRISFNPDHTVGAVLHVNGSSGIQPVPSVPAGLAVHRGSVDGITPRDHAALWWVETEQTWYLAFNTDGDDETLGALNALRVSELNVNAPPLAGFAMRVDGDVHLDTALVVVGPIGCQVINTTGLVRWASSTAPAAEGDLGMNVANGRPRAFIDGALRELAHTGEMVLATRTLTAGAGLTGGGDLSADRTFDVVAHADGSIVVNANDIQVGVLATDAQHGVRGGGTQHAAAIASGAAGFMTGADKSKLDGIEAGAVALPVVDTTAVVKGSADATKLVRIEADGLTTGTTRVLTMPDSDITPVNFAGQLGGTAIVPDVRGVRETGGPTLLAIDAIADGQLLQRSGTRIIGVAGAPVDAPYLTNGAVTGLSAEVNIQSHATPLFFQPTADAIAAWQVRNAAGAEVLSVDTTNQNVGVRTGSPSFPLDVNGAGRFAGLLQCDTAVDVVAGAFLALGPANRATTGDLRLGNAFVMRARNVANSANVDVLTLNSSDNITLGQNTAANIDIRAQDRVTIYVAVGGALEARSTFIRSFVPQINFEASVAAPTVLQTTTGSASVTAQPMTFSAQDASGTNATGGKLTVRAGDGTNATGGSEGTGGHMLVRAGRKGGGTKTDGNIALHADPAAWSGERVIFVGNATTVPSSNPASGGFLYTEAGALKYRGSSGTITTLGPA